MKISHARHAFLLATISAACGIAASTHAETIVGPKWVNMNATNPPPKRFEHTAIFDPVRRRMVVFGGEDSTDTNRNDVWVLPLSGSPAWTQLSTNSGPDIRADHVAVYDSKRDRMIIFGGETGADDDRYGDMWALSFSDNTWTQLPRNFFTNPCTRSGSYAVYDPDHDRVLIYGGKTSPAILPDEYTDMWAYSFASNAWYQPSRKTPTDPCNCHDDSGSGACADQPSRRQYGIAVYDPSRQLTWLHGGWYTGQPNFVYSDTWTYPKSATDTLKWKQRSPSGSAPERQNHRAVLDSRRDRILTFGGTDYMEHIENGWSGPFNTVHQLTLSDTMWSQLSPSGTPPTPREYSAAVYDSVGDRMVIFGGSPDSGYTNHPNKLNDTWELDLDNVAPATVTNLAPTVHCESIDISWTAPGDDGSTGTATAYDLRSSSSNITEANFNSAAQLDAPTPSAAGSTESVNIYLGPCSATKYYALKTRDEVGNWSSISNVFHTHTPCVDNCDDLAIRPFQTAFELKEPSPNPARQAATLRYAIPGRQDGQAIRLTILDVSGRRVRTLLDGTAKSGADQVVWDLLSDNGRLVRPGMYFVRLTLGSDVKMRTVLVTR